jgi:hypothetical protein
MWCFWTRTQLGHSNASDKDPAHALGRYQKQNFPTPSSVSHIPAIHSRSISSVDDGVRTQQEIFTLDGTLDLMLILIASFVKIRTDSVQI